MKRYIRGKKVCGQTIRIDWKSAIVVIGLILMFIA